MEWLSGKKTYIMGGAGVVVCALYIFGVIDGDMATQAMEALGFGSIITLRAAIAKGA